VKFQQSFFASFTGKKNFAEISAKLSQKKLAKKLAEFVRCFRKRFVRAFVLARKLAAGQNTHTNKKARVYTHTWNRQRARKLA
jgi:hypothetical protein